MTDTLKKEIHARHLNFLSRMKEKSEKLLKNSSSNAKEISELFARDRQVIESLRPRWKKEALYICEQKEVSWMDIVSENKTPNAVLARNEICWHMARNLKMSPNKIGTLIKRDQSTVRNSIKRHQKLLDDQNASAKI